MKYKHGATPGEYHFIDDAGNKTASWNKNNKPGMFAEMQEWLKIPGNEIEAHETPEDLEKKEATENQASLEAQPSTCAALLRETDHKVSSKYRFQDDVPEWDLYREKIYAILQSDSLETIPKKPFPK